MFIRGIAFPSDIVGLDRLYFVAFSFSFFPVSEVQARRSAVSYLGAWKFFILRVKDPWAVFLCEVIFFIVFFKVFPLTIAFVSSLQVIILGLCDCPDCDMPSLAV